MHVLKSSILGSTFGFLSPLQKKEEIADIQLHWILVKKKLTKKREENKPQM